MTPAVNPIEVLQAEDKWNFHDKANMNLPRHRRSQGRGGGQNRIPSIEMPPTEVESLRTSLASRIYFEVIYLGLEAWSPRKLLGSRTALFFEPLKSCWKTPETSRKTLRRPFLFSSFGDCLKKCFWRPFLFFFVLRSLENFSEKPFFLENTSCACVLDLGLERVWFWPRALCHRLHFWPPVIKIITTKRDVFFSFSFFKHFRVGYNSICVQQTSINDQVGGMGLLKSNFCHPI